MTMPDSLADAYRKGFEDGLDRAWTELREKLSTTSEAAYIVFEIPRVPEPNPYLPISSRAARTLDEMLHSFDAQDASELVLHWADKAETLGFCLASVRSSTNLYFAVSAAEVRVLTNAGAGVAES